MAKCEECNGRGRNNVDSGPIPGGISGGGFTYSEKCSPCRGTGTEGGHCFPSYAKVLTINGYNNISGIKYGDVVVSISTKGILSYQKVLKINTYNKSPIFKIVLVGGEILSTTKSHSYKLLRGLDRAENIVANDVIMGLEGKEYKVESSYLSTESEPVYNLIVDNNYTFIVDGAQVHCFSYFRETRMFLWSLYSKFSRVIESLLNKNHLLDNSIIAT